jgi:hypothetical protein
MLKSKTVFIIGAGASHEANLPIGRDLRKIIYDKVDFRADNFGRRDAKYGDSRLLDWIRRQHGDKANNYFNACGRIRAGILTSASIDDFLDVHRDDGEMVECGKLAIARAILEAEKSSLLAYDTTNIYNRLDLAPLENTWYMGFFRLLHEGLSKSKRAEIFANATVVCFNYDRCIEHFLVHALAAHYVIPMDEAREHVRHLRIHHPYGSVGTLDEVPFGVPDVQDFRSITKNIKTYTEQITDDDTVKAIQASIRDARVVVFLGNAFHANNMKLVLPAQIPDDGQPQKNVYFTRYGISDGDVRVVSQGLLRLLKSAMSTRGSVPERFFRYTDTCYKLFEEFRLSLRQ